jgi:lipopolysaccharide export system protein LptA
MEACTGIVQDRITAIFMPCGNTSPAMPLSTSFMRLSTLLRASLGAKLLFVWVVAVSQAAHADATDRDQPLSFAADSIRVDEKKRLNIMQGNVEISKGSIVVRADRVEVLQGADGSQKATATGGAGGKALFRQRRAGRDEMIEGEADSVTYNSRTDEVNFSGRAVMRRMIGATVVDEVSGQSIVYDNKTDVFQVVGGQGTTATKGRVRGVISPRKSVSTSTVPTDPVVLQPSPALMPSKEGTRR